MKGGYFAGQHVTTGNSNIFIGNNSGPNAFTYGNITNSIAIGAGVASNVNNQVVIGNNSSSTIGGFQNWTNYSDGRMKKNVQENVPGLGFITKLRPVTYNRSVDDANSILGMDTIYDRSSSMYDVEKVRYTGLIAQEVEAAAQEIGYDFSGVKPAKHNNDLYSVSYSELIMPLIKAVQELNAENEKLKMEGEVLKIESATLKEKLTLLEKQNASIVSEFAQLKAMIVENKNTQVKN